MSRENAGHVPSNEVDEKQLRMALDEGDAYQRALSYMIEEVADAGAKKTAGDYIVAIAQERAEGMYHLKSDGELIWSEPEDENCHLEVSVSDAADHRFIPALDIEATLVPQAGEPVGPLKVPFLWHPGLYHCGVNIRVPGSGKYKVKLRISAPTFWRHGKINGRRFANTINVKFTDIEIKTGHE